MVMLEIELIEFTKIINPPWCGTAGVEDHFLPMGSCVCPTQTTPPTTQTDLATRITLDHGEC